MAFALAHAHDPQDDPCVLWPFGQSKGYGVIEVDGRSRYAHNYVTELRDGPAPVGMEAIHGPCHNRLCIIHSRWGTRADNMADTIRDGTSQRGIRNRNAKLTPADVAPIRKRIDGGETFVGIAADYGVVPDTIRAIKRGLSWTWLDQDA